MGKVVVKNLVGPNDMQQFVDSFGEFTDGAIIKPNWTSADYGFYTDVQSLELLLRCIPGKKYIIESYMFGRTDGSIEITSDNGKQHWQWLRTQDQAFLESSGVGELLAKYDAEYINISEEWWSGRCVPAAEIQQLVESKYRPVNHKELYSGVPQKLFDLSRMPLISYAKFKYNLPSVSNFSSFAMKNMFGLIPVPNRESYHGADFDVGLSRSIVDIVTIYKALFRTIGIVEGVYHIPVTRNEGENKYKMIWTEYDVIENAGMILGSEDLLTLDAVANKLAGIDPDSRSILKIGASVFGAWDTRELQQISEEMMQIFA